MSWVPAEEGDVPTLGWVAIEWIEAFIPIPDGDLIGEPMKLYPYQANWLLHYYQLHENAVERVAADVRNRPSRAFVYQRGGIMLEPQKKGKSPFGAALALFEGLGPARFDGWDAYGQPVGRPWMSALIPITAQTETQGKNVWDALLSMVQLETSGLQEAGVDMDAGMTRIFLPNRGEIRPVTSSARSAQGGRITFSVQDEAQGWTEESGGVKLADAQYRSLAGMGGRFAQFGNAYDPNQRSVAQRTWEDKSDGVWKSRTDCGPGSIRNHRERMAMLSQVYSGAENIDKERISIEIDTYISQGDVAKAERFFLNRNVPGEDRAFDANLWRALAQPHEVEPKSVITIGVDGARSEDAFAIVATEAESGYQFVLGIWTRPEDAPEDYEHPFEEADGVMVDAFDRYKVWRVLVDPGSQTGNISPVYERWAGRWGEKVVLPFLMTRPKPTAMMLRNYVSAIEAGDVTNDGDEVMAQHIANARRREVNVRDEDAQKMWTIYKEAPKSPLKIDAAAAGALSWEARGQCVAAGAAKKRKSAYSGRVCRCPNGPQPSHIRSSRYGCPPA